MQLFHQVLEGDPPRSPQVLRFGVVGVLVCVGLDTCRCKASSTGIPVDQQTLLAVGFQRRYRIHQARSPFHFRFIIQL
ncbi:MAG: hypothetical protein AAFY20_18470 [Cyanobacteria bacterium J06639_14]